MNDRPGPPPAPPPGHASPLRLVRDLLALDRVAVAILVTVPVVLTLLEFFGLPWHYTRWHLREAQITSNPPPPGITWMMGIRFPRPAGLTDARWETLQPYLWWGLSVIVLLVLIPMCVGAASGLSPRRLGIRLKGTGRDAWTYLTLFVVFFPVIWLVSQRADFQKTYPFYKPMPGHLGADFLLFEAVYCLQFFAIEFFFRGFIVLGLKRRIGVASVLVMIAPYCMIHYYKPFPEAMGAIGAGLVLGLLSWRTETILYGWFLHYGVALSMDLLALHQVGSL